MKQIKENQDDSSDRNHDYYCLGCKAFDASHYQEALTFFKHSLEYWPEDSQAWMAVGDCYDELKRYKKAEKAFRCALQHASEKDTEKIVFNLGNSLFDQEQYSEAIELYETIKSGSELWRKAQCNIGLAKSRL